MARVIAVYGSLKMGRYNHPIIKGCEYLGSSFAKGTMYSLGLYPALVEEGDKEHKVELYSVDNEKFFEVWKMETDSGYKQVKKVFEHLNNYDSSKPKLQTEATIFYAGTWLTEYCKKHNKVINYY